MKKSRWTGICLSAALLLIGCANGAGTAHTQTNSNSVSSVLAAEMAKADGTAEQDPIPSEIGDAELSEWNDAEIPILSRTEGIDVDLTILSPTLIYSEVYNMMYSPSEYLGKTIRIEGQYNQYHDPVTEQDYFACVIADATACCAQGMEFVLTDAYRYPEDYPQTGSTIVVTGVFDTYLEDGYEYCTLRNATLG